MHRIEQLFENNRAWAAEHTRRDPDYFARLARQQQPEYLWIGCSDSRVPANDIVGLAPGELFVHRNIANLVLAADLNCLSVLQFAVDVLRVRHIIVCGHYECGGVLAALRGERLGVVDNWLRPVAELRCRHAAELAGLEDEAARHRRLCELNVREQVRNVGRSTVLQAAWGRCQAVAVHGWIYDVADGLLHDLGIRVTSEADLA